MISSHPAFYKLLFCVGHFDALKYNCWDMCRAHFLVYESLLDDSMDQMCGFTHVGDGGGVTGAHITSWSPTDFARLLKWGEVLTYLLISVYSTIPFLCSSVEDLSGNKY